MTGYILALIMLLPSGEKQVESNILKVYETKASCTREGTYLLTTKPYGNFWPDRFECLSLDEQDS